MSAAPRTGAQSTSTEAALVERLKKMRAVRHKAGGLAYWATRSRLLSVLTLVAPSPTHTRESQHTENIIILPRRGPVRMLMEKVCTSLNLFPI